MDRVEIPNQATYSPLALTDVFMLAPLASRVLLGTTMPSRIVQVLALGAYAGSALSDWVSRRDARPIDFGKVFGQDLSDLEPMTDEDRQAEVEELVQKLNDNYDPVKISREELAVLANERLTDYIASITE